MMRPTAILIASTLITSTSLGWSREARATEVVANKAAEVAREADAGVHGAGVHGAGVHVVTVDEREPLAFLLVTPTGQVAHANASDIIRSTAERLEADTNFALRVTDALSVRECRGRLGCMIRKIRPDYDRPPTERRGPSSRTQNANPQNAETEEPATEGPHDPRLPSASMTTERHTETPRYLLLLSNVALGPSGDQLSMTLVDMDEALAIYLAAQRRARAPLDDSRSARADYDWEVEADAAISERAIVSGPRTKRLTDAREVSAFLDQVFREDLRPAFLRTGHWTPYGQIEIQLATRGYEILLDGVTVGATAAGTTRIEHVTAGRRVLGLRRADVLPYEQTLEIARNETVVLTPVMTNRAPDWRAERNVVIYGGGAVALAGGVLLAIALSRSGADTTLYCVTGERCHDTQLFQRATFSNDGSPTFGSSAKGRGPMLAPLGYSLVLTGATWSVGSLLSDEEAPPWLELGAGVLVGVLAYSVSAILESKDPLTP
ncbi:MAG: hypothetical protein H6729_08735 [Deltaproteobacteria bacterium]|nr:hypothetical protein [Deltaproteobacteria bacterium]